MNSAVVKGVDKIVLAPDLLQTEKGWGTLGELPTRDCSQTSVLGGGLESLDLYRI